MLGRDWLVGNHFLPELAYLLALLVIPTFQTLVCLGFAFFKGVILATPPRIKPSHLLGGHMEKKKMLTLLPGKVCRNPACRQENLGAAS